MATHKKTATAIGVRNRIVGLRQVRAGDLLPNPKNWRTHHESQKDALRGILNEVGYVDALLARETPEGLQLIDGHLRAGIDPDAEVPVLVVDLDEAEADKVLATFDPLAAMAETDSRMLESLLREIETGDDAVAQLLTDLAAEAGIVPEGDAETVLKPVSVLPPPKMTWVLIGIPTVRFGEINGTVEQLSQIDGIIIESTSNDG